MCGIFGYAGASGDQNLLHAMADSVTHRGPDDSGFLVERSVGMGMCRLSIIDVAGGHQPIFNEDQSIAIVFNGEIYNYRALMADLERRGHRFRTRSDTETIVHLYEEYGIECLRHLRGMFAFALFDARTQTLFLVRDRLGIKPLYYWLHGGRLVFASEAKAILEAPGVPREPNLAAIDAYLSLRYVPGPQTLFSGIHKLPAGHWLSFGPEARTELRQYWSHQFPAGANRPDKYYHERFAELFEETVRLHLESDVPVGAFLSGGLDSTAIVATMRRLTDGPIHTFSAGFGSSHDELTQARASAQLIGTTHHEVVCEPEHMALLPKIVWHLDEPIGDAIVLPMYLLSQSARRHVKVVLSGEGADETLAGYLFHKVMYWAGRYARWTPGTLQERLFQPLLERVPTGVLNRAFSYPASLGERGRQKVLDYAELVRRRDPAAEYRFLISLFDDRDKTRLYDSSLRRRLHAGGLAAETGTTGGEPNNPYLHRLLSLQYEHWLPDDILMKADKTSMANSVEGRVPFMDHVLVEFLAQVPPHLKLRGWTEKFLLRRYTAGLLPGGEHARRKKKPFYIPLERYLGTPTFMELVDACLSEQTVRRRGYFDWRAVRSLKDAMHHGDFLYGKQVLSLVALELWHRIFIDREKGWV